MMGDGFHFGRSGRCLIIAELPSGGVRIGGNLELGTHGSAGLAPRPPSLPEPARPDVSWIAIGECDETTASLVLNGSPVRRGPAVGASVGGAQGCRAAIDLRLEKPQPIAFPSYSSSPAARLPKKGERDGNSTL